MDSNLCVVFINIETNGDEDIHQPCDPEDDISDAAGEQAMNHDITNMNQLPRTRSGDKRLRERFIGSVQSFND